MANSRIGMWYATGATQPSAATLRDGTVVLGKAYKGEICACTYANRTQAQTAAAKHNGEVIHRGRPFYVKLPWNIHRVVADDCEVPQCVLVENTGGDRFPVAVSLIDEIAVRPTSSLLKNARKEVAS